jgi:3-hydroxyisobutyrate dehydrogenase-like beta-hydroxyacid dehydrogenase
VGTSHEVGIIGIGAMGTAFAERLLATGFTPLLYNRSDAAIERMVERGAARGSSAADVARRSSTVLTVLPRSQDVNDVYHGTDTAEGILDAATPGTLLIDCSTIAPKTSRAVAARASANGLTFADAGVGGLPPDARAGRATFMYGSAENDAARVERALAPLAGHCLRCGPPGSGVTVKLINNLLANTIHVADLEALAMAERSGIDIEVLRDVISTTAAGNNYMRDRIPAELADRDYVPGFAVGLAAKDVALGRELAAELDVPIKALASSAALLGEAQARGYGHLANSVLLRALREQIEAAGSADPE